MRLLFFNLKPSLALYCCCLLMIVLASCSPVAQTDVSLDYVAADRAIDPESAALEAFARAHLLSIDGDFTGSLEAIEQAISINPDSAFLHMSKAEILLHLGRLEDAKIALEKTLSLDPGMLDAHLILSEILSARGEYEGAIASLKAASLLKPDDEQITLNLALAHARNQNPQAAVAMLERLIRDNSKNVEARMALARIHQLSQLPALSIEAYRSLLKVQPEHEQATLELGALFQESNQLSQATELYNDFLVIVPDSSRVRYQLVRIHLEQNRLESALQQLALIVENNPEDIDALYKIGLIRLQQQKPALAEAAFRKILEIKSDSATYYALGIALEEGEKWTEALQAFAVIASDTEHFPDAVIHRAYLLPKLERRDEAILLLETHIESLESMPELYEYLASLHGKDKDWPQALRVLDDGLVLFPENASLLLRKALILDLAGETVDALDLAEKVLGLDPENAEVLNFMAYTYAVQNVRLADAERLVLKALKHSDAPHIRDTYGWVLYRQGRFDEALVELELALSELPDDATVLEHLGDLYVELDRNADALALYRKALSTGRALAPEALQKKIDPLLDEQ